MNVAQLTFQSEIRRNRDEQIKELEETLSKETERTNDLKSKLTDSRNTVSQMEVNVTESQAETKCLKEELNHNRNEKERLACQLADISGSAIASAQSLTSKNESLQKMVSTFKINY